MHTANSRVNGTINRVSRNGTSAVLFFTACKDACIKLANFIAVLFFILYFFSLQFLRSFYFPTIENSNLHASWWFGIFSERKLETKVPSRMELLVRRTIFFFFPSLLFFFREIFFSRGGIERERERGVRSRKRRGGKFIKLHLMTNFQVSNVESVPSSTLGKEL